MNEAMDDLRASTFVHVRLNGPFAMSTWRMVIRPNSELTSFYVSF